MVYSSKKAMICMAIICISLCLMLLHGNCTEFKVGDSKGWGVTPEKEPNTYNLWAEKKRFKVNDTLEFQYKKDSVMWVTNEAEYEKCKSSSPIYYGNNGDTHIQLNRSGLFYFISGVLAHCDRGQKMVVKVLDVESPPDQQSPPSDDDHSDDKKKKNGAPRFEFMGVSSILGAVVGFVMA